MTKLIQDVVSYLLFSSNLVKLLRKAWQAAATGLCGHVGRVGGSRAPGLPLYQGRESPAAPELTTDQNSASDS